MSTTLLCAALTRVSALVVAASLLSANVAVAQRPTPPPPKAGDLSAMDLEQLMTLEVVVAGSKRAQLTRDVPSFVSVVTAAEIKEHSYRTLADVLKSLPSFYVTNDRSHSFIGVRGFDRPGDYSSRILMLLNGLRTNDNVFDQAYIGEEFVVDVDLIDRIEVVRGPSAALYGSNAFFAVINVVTKQGVALQGGELAMTAASFGTYAGRASYGRQFSNDLDVVVSASGSDSKGQRLFYPEFNSPATNNGIADKADYENFHKLLATVTKGNFSFQASDVSRQKGIPTGLFSATGAAFNDPRTRSTDALSLASLGYNRSFVEGTSVSTRIHAGRWGYRGEFVFDPRIAPVRAEQSGEWVGADVDARRTISRHLVTVGAEVVDNTKQNQKAYQPDPFIVYTDIQNKSVRWGMFAQDEIKLFTPLMLYAGARYDHYQTFGTAISPRVGLIYTPSNATTVKLLAGRAFRAPNVYELYQENTLFRANPLLQPERIETLELIAQRFIGGGVQISASTFRNRLHALISQRFDNNQLVFQNADQIESKGVELGLEVNRGHGVSGGLTYALQRTEDLSTRAELSNSPRHMVKSDLRAPLGIGGLVAGVDAQYMSTRRTLTAKTDPAYTIANVSLLAPHLAGRFDVSAAIYNVFGTKYSDPGTAANVQDIIQQDGRSLRVKTSLHF